MREVLTTAAAAAVVAALVLPGPAAGQARENLPALPPSAHVSTARLLDVPFVAQERLLCGAAAVEMALRHAGARGVYARDFRGIVREAEGGIRTDELAAAVRALGWEVRAGPSDVTDLHAQIESGRPVTVLLAERPGRYHYVLVVGWSADAFIVHDPGRAPGVRIGREDFLQRWEEAGRWGLAVVSPTASALPSATPARATAAPSASSPLLEEASQRFRESRWTEASQLARAATQGSPDDKRAWALLGTSSYLAGDLRGALEAWSEERPPVVDALTVSGLRRTRHPVVHELMGLRPGATLTRSAFDRAERRLSLLPSARATSLTYRALPDGIAHVEATAHERSFIPSGVVPIAAALLPALVESELRLLLPLPSGGGEAVTLGARWSQARPAASVRFAAPTAPASAGRLAVVFAIEQERHALSQESVQLERRSGGRIVLTDWASGWLRWEITSGLERWQEGTRAGVLGGALELRTHDDRARIAASLLGASGGPGSAGYARWTLEGSALPMRAGSPWRLAVRALATGVGERAPRMLWPGVDVGRAREGLLRAHPLEREGSLSDGGLGTLVLNSTLELERRVATLPFAQLAVAAFTDGARIRSPSLGLHAPSALRNLLDAGGGLRVTLPEGRLRADVAWSRDGSRALSAGWEARGIGR